MKLIAKALGAALLLTTALGGLARAQADGPVRIAVMNDQTSAYADTSGRGSVVAAQLAIQDFGGKLLGQPIELLSLDDQGKVDIATAQARKAIDVDKVSAFFDIANSSVSLAMQEIAKQNDKVIVHVGSASADLYGKACSPTGALWEYDTYSLAKGLAEAIYDDKHQDWFFLTVDYAFGAQMQKDMAQELQNLGGHVVGTVRHPLNTADFSSFLMQASATSPQVMALLNAGADTTTSIKQAGEFGLLTKGVKLAVPILTLVNVHAIGPELAQGTTFLVGYYWDRDDASRAFAKRFAETMQRPPTHAQAAVYSAVLHYLKAAEASKSLSGRTVMDKMKELPVNDFMTDNAKLRADGRLMRDMLLVEVKKPQDVKKEWDLLEVRGVAKADKIIRPLTDGGCPMVGAAK